MTVFIFILILLVLIVVHEFGHFIAAKKSGIRVDEFGVGFPPRLFGWKRGETKYSINAIPFGGFVKIFGENGEDIKDDDKDKSRSFSARPRGLQALVLVMGVVFNILFAWFLISTSFFIGAPASVSMVDDASRIKDPVLTVTGILPGSPASTSGIMAGDKVLKITDSLGREMITQTPEDVQNFVESSDGGSLNFFYERDGQEDVLEVTPILEDSTLRIGVGLDVVGIYKTSIFQSIKEGAILTGEMTRGIAVSFVNLIKDSIKGNADIKDLSGPVGIAGVVQDASRSGFANLLFLSAFISINLAVLNMIPFPALDGGRLFFLLIEAIKGSSLPKAISLWANAIGFFLLIALMLVVTFNDIVKLL